MTVIKQVSVSSPKHMTNLARYLNDDRVLARSSQNLFNEKNWEKEFEETRRITARGPTKRRAIATSPGSPRPPDPLKEVEYLEEALANAMEGYAAPQEAYEPLPESLRRGVHSTVFVMRMLHNDRPGWKQAGREDRVGEDELRSEQESRKPLRGHSESLCQMAEGLFFIGGIQRGVIFAPHRDNRANRLLQSTSSDLECPTIQGAPSSTFCSSLARI